MLTNEQILTLRKVNISKDSEKSKARIAEDFKALKNNVKNAVIDLSGLKRRSFYSTFSTGVATAKIVISLAQVTNVSPFYYTGESDEKEPFTEELLNKFLDGHGYKNLMTEKTKRKYTRKAKDTDVPKDDGRDAPCTCGAETEGGDWLDGGSWDCDDPCECEDSWDCDDSCECEDELEDAVVYTVTFADTPKMDEALASLDGDTAALLLKALIKRAEAGGEAEELCDIVKRCLLA